MHVVGVLQYANSAFEFDAGSWNKFTELLGSLIDTYSGAPTEETTKRTSRTEFLKRWRKPEVQEGAHPDVHRPHFERLPTVLKTSLA